MVGVAADAAHQGRLTPDANPRDVYFPHVQVPLPWVNLVVRVEIEPTVLTDSVREVVRRLDSDLALYNISTVEEVVATETLPVRFASVLSGLFATAAVLLATLGVYSVLAFGVAQRTNEFGIRIAMGARPADVFRLVLGQGARLSLAGLVAGVFGALALTRYLGSLLFEISPMDPLTYGASATLLMAVALVACVVSRPSCHAGGRDGVLAPRVADSIASGLEAPTRSTLPGARWQTIHSLRFHPMGVR